MILNSFSTFLESILGKLKEKNFDYSEFKIDHLGYQASCKKDYHKCLEEIGNVSQLLKESQVGGRSVAVLKLNKPLQYNKDKIYIIEIVEPKAGQETPSFWQHIELVSNNTLEEIVQKYPDLDWEKKAMKRDIFPMLILKLNGGLSVKFPKLPVEEELRRQNII